MEADTVAKPHKWRKQGVYTDLRGKKFGDYNESIYMVRRQLWSECILLKIVEH